MKGRIKKDFHLKKEKLFKTDIIVVGDFVDFVLNNDSTGVINQIFPRKNYISRKAPKLKGAGYRGERLEQIVVANIDNFFAVVSVSQPEFNNKVLDRLLITGESAHINCFIIFNKVDLDENKEINFWANLYSKIGYRVIKSSTKTCEGVEEIKKIVACKKNFFWGSSGVGKSSIINKIFPDLNLTTGEISSFSGKGVHTTVTVNMLEPEKDTFIIDTPGIREIEPYGLKKTDIGHYFIEFFPFINECKYNTCTHQHEPECAIIDAVNKRLISEERYDSYLRILETIEDDILF